MATTMGDFFTYKEINHISKLRKGGSVISLLEKGATNIEREKLGEFYSDGLTWRCQDVLMVFRYRYTNK